MPYDPPPNPATIPADNITILLTQQITALDQIFQHYLSRIATGSFSEDRLATALRAQSQCRTTARTLQQWQRQQDNDKPDSDKA